jgi:hypothetical protein
MSRTLTPGGTDFGVPWASEAAMEWGLAIAAAGFTVVIWLSSGSGATAQQDALRQAAAQSQQTGAKHITLATVLVRATSR